MLLDDQRVVCEIRGCQLLNGDSQSQIGWSCAYGQYFYVLMSQGRDYLSR